MAAHGIAIDAGSGLWYDDTVGMAKALAWSEMAALRDYRAEIIGRVTTRNLNQSELQRLLAPNL
ncbi:MAG: hypothetical protein LH632_22615 [Rhodoferax sp.]|nr:hypothetical protein [Rhodoferax sp.]